MEMTDVWDFIYDGRPEIKINTLSVEEIDKLTKMIASGMSPPIFRYNTAQTPELLRANKLLIQLAERREHELEKHE